MKISDLTEAFHLAFVQTLVPEIKQLKEEITERFAKVDERFVAMQKLMDERFTKMDERFDRMMQVLMEMRGDIKQFRG